MFFLAYENLAPLERKGSLQWRFYKYLVPPGRRLRDRTLWQLAPRDRVSPATDLRDETLGPSGIRTLSIEDQILDLGYRISDIGCSGIGLISGPSTEFYEASTLFPLNPPLTGSAFQSRNRFRL
jgi:hypothetical protein